MPDLTIGNVPEGTVRKLTRQAVARGISVQDYLLEVLDRQVTSPNRNILREHRDVLGTLHSGGGYEPPSREEVLSAVHQSRQEQDERIPIRF